MHLLEAVGKEIVGKGGGGRKVKHMGQMETMVLGSFQEMQYFTVVPMLFLLRMHLHDIL